MQDLQTAYVENLTLFFRILRDNGLTVATPEAVDALRLLDGELLANPDQLRLAMASILAKSPQEQVAFHKCFDNFFVTKQTRQTMESQAQEVAQAEEARRAKAEEELTCNGRQLPLDDDLVETYVTMDEDRRQRLKDYLGMSTDNPRGSPFAFKFMKKILEQYLRAEDALERSGGAQMEHLSGDLRYKDISQISEAEMPRAVALIATLVKQLDGAISRKYRRSKKKGRLDFRGTIGLAMGTGGTFARLKYKQRPKSRKKVVLLCDVSRSMVQYSEFAIRFLKSVSDVSPNSQVFVFSEGLQEVSPFVLADMSLFQRELKDSDLWGKGTDLADAFQKLLAVRPSVLSSNTIFMIISDTKTIATDQARYQMERAVSKAGKTLWLNPIPSRRWAKIPSVQAFADLCQMMDASTIDQLSKACARGLS